MLAAMVLHNSLSFAVLMISFLLILSHWMKISKNEIIRTVIITSFVISHAYLIVFWFMLLFNLPYNFDSIAKVKFCWWLSVVKFCYAFVSFTGVCFARPNTTFPTKEGRYYWLGELFCFFHALIHFCHNEQAFKFVSILLLFLSKTVILSIKKIKCI